MDGLSAPATSGAPGCLSVPGQPSAGQGAGTAGMRTPLRVCLASACQPTDARMTLLVDRQIQRRRPAAFCWAAISGDCLPYSSGYEQFGDSILTVATCRRCPAFAVYGVVTLVCAVDVVARPVSVEVFAPVTPGFGVPARVPVISTLCPAWADRSCDPGLVPCSRM